MSRVKWERNIVLLSLLISIVLFVPFLGVQLSSKNAAQIHILSYLILGLFFEIPELILGCRCLWIARNEETLRKNWEVLKRIYQNRYYLTHFVAPSSGIMTVGSGLYLIYIRDYSLTEGWLFWILGLSTIGLYKGMNHHNPYIKSLLTRVHQIKNENDPSLDVIRRAINSPFDQTLIFSELPTYALNYVLGYFRFVKFPHPALGMVSFLESWFHSGAIAGLVMVGLGSLLIVPLKLSMRRFSRIY